MVGEGFRSFNEQALAVRGYTSRELRTNRFQVACLELNADLSYKVYRLYIVTPYTSFGGLRNKLVGDFRSLADPLYKCSFPASTAIDLLFRRLV